MNECLYGQGTADQNECVKECFKYDKWFDISTNKIIIYYFHFFYYIEGSSRIISKYTKTSVNDLFPA